MVYQAIIESPQLTLFDSVLDWVVATNVSLFKQVTIEMLSMIKSYAKLWGIHILRNQMIII